MEFLETIGIIFIKQLIMNIELRDPNVVMKLSRLGSFHQSKLIIFKKFFKRI